MGPQGLAYRAWVTITAILGVGGRILTVYAPPWGDVQKKVVIAI